MDTRQSMCILMSKSTKAYVVSKFMEADAATKSAKANTRPKLDSQHKYLFLEDQIYSKFGI